jgi:geranylgeranyl reductase family protein
MNHKYDVVVIGAGPVGAYTAYLLADKGFEVGLLEKNRTMAEDIVCTGIIGKEAFERYDLPKDSILKTVRSIVFVSPSNQRLQYDHPGDLAYVVDRTRFDSEIVERAKNKGVDVRFGEEVMEVECETGYAGVRSKRNGVEGMEMQNEKCKVKNAKWKELGISGGKCRTRVVVVATGVNYRLQSALGMGVPPGFLSGAQVEVEVAGVDSAIEIYTGRDVAPGSFGWVVPLGNGKSRVGVLIRSGNGVPNGAAHLERLMQERLSDRISDVNRAAIRQKPIAYGPMARSVVDKVLAVGGAAGQIKTTTGGGIFYGLLGSELAAATIARVLKNGTLNSDGLMEYERAWRKRLDSEFKAGYRIRAIAEQLDDKAVDWCFSLMKRNRLLVRLIKKRVNFEYHSKLLSFCLKAFRSVLR